MPASHSPISSPSERHRRRDGPPRGISDLLYVNRVVVRLPSPASVLQGRRLLRQFCLLIGLLAATSTAHGVPAIGLPRCGQYVSGAGKSLFLDTASSGRAEHRSPSQKIVRVAFTYSVSADELRAVGEDDLRFLELERGRAPHTLIFEDTTYTLESTGSECLPSPPSPKPSCREDLLTCAKAVRRSPNVEGPIACNDGVAFGCNAWLDALAEGAVASSSPHCNGPTMDTGCGVSVAARAIDDASLDAVVEACSRTRSTSVCMRGAIITWAAGRFLLSRTALATACAAGAGETACKPAKELATLAPDDLMVVPLQRLPCGIFGHSRDSLGELNFGDRGVVTSRGGVRFRARLDQGVVVVRRGHGVESKFVGNVAGDLFGLTYRDRYTHLARRPNANATCQPPPQYRLAATPTRPLLPEPQLQQACATGDPHACYAKGNWKLLQQGPDAAIPFFVSACKQDVLDACEGLVDLGVWDSMQALMKGRTPDDVSPQEALRYLKATRDNRHQQLAEICTSDPLSVACDVLELAP